MRRALCCLPSLQGGAGNSLTAACSSQVAHQLPCIQRFSGAGGHAVLWQQEACSSCQPAASSSQASSSNSSNSSSTGTSTSPPPWQQQQLACISAAHPVLPQIADSQCNWLGVQQQHRSRCAAPEPLPLLHQAVRQCFTHQPSRLHQLLQHHHHHHSPAHQLQQQRGMKQLRPYAEAPKLPPRFRRPDMGGRLNRMVIRIPPQVQVAVADGKLSLTGKAGSTSLRLSTLDPSGMVAWRCLSQSAAAAAEGPGTGSLLLMVSPGKRHWRSIQTHIDNAVHGVMQGYLVGLTVQGVGYRLEPVPEDVVKAAIRARKGDAAAEDAGVKRPMFWEQEAGKSNIAYPHKQPGKAVRLKVGFTKAAIFPLPEGVLGFFVKPTLMYLYGVDKQLVTSTATAIRAVRKPNAYTGNGIQLVGENMKLKQRAGSK